MSLHQESDESYIFPDALLENDKELIKKNRIRRLLEDRLEQKRLKEELDDFDNEFNWDDF